MAEPLFDLLLRHCSAAEQEVLLVAPFVKEHVARRLITAVPSGVTVGVVTRWRLDEIASGISDLDVWRVVAERDARWGNARMYLLPRLHAKVYRSDDRVLVGSANLTGQGLGLMSPNLEILVEVSAADARAQEVEDQVRAEGRLVDEGMYARFLKLVEALPRSVDDEVQPGPWLPRFRRPSHLVGAVFDGEYPGESRQAALSDLHALGVPADLPSHLMHSAIALAFSETQVVQDVLRWAVQTRRFGELREWVRAYRPDLKDPTGPTQTLYRWIQAFLPDRFLAERANYSETLVVRS